MDVDDHVEDVLVQGGVAIAAGVIFSVVLFLPWLSAEYSAIAGLIQARSQASVVVPMTLIILSIMTVFGGVVHIAGYKVGIQLVTIMSAIAFFISVMAIVATLASAAYHEGTTLQLLIGPWIGVAGAIFGIVSSRLERK